MSILIDAFVSTWHQSPFADLKSEPWNVTGSAEQLIKILTEGLGKDYVRNGDTAIHISSNVENGAILKGPVVLGPGCLVASGSYLRGGVFLERSVIVGPNCELKTTFMFAGSKVAHLSFVGDSIVGAGVNIEAGAIVANYRNEKENKRILIDHRGKIIDTGVEKFGALIGDNVRIGANAVVAPGALMEAGFKLPRLELLDQYPQTN